jgi:hypothetical protein
MELSELLMAFNDQAQRRTFLTIKRIQGISDRLNPGGNKLKQL